ncbi:MAG: hypothetical protein C0404_05565 [Verrucomicrobia bacterium]|nr:hypothetical protein [Verrucomicrobiota bacterium]
MRRTRVQMSIRVGGFQMPVTRDVGANKAAIIEGIDRASKEQIEILLTPEGALSGYTHEFSASDVRNALDEVAAFAKQKGVGLALGTCIYEDDGKCYNQLRFYKPDGEYLGFHSKTLCCGSHDIPPQGEVRHFAVAPLRVFNWGQGLVIGGLICNDMWANPECTPMPDSHLSQRLSGMGARIIFHAANSGRDATEWSDVFRQFHESNLRIRSRSGKVWIVTVDNSYPENLLCAAPSGVLKPDGTWVCKAEQKGRQLYAFTIDV